MENPWGEEPAWARDDTDGEPGEDDDEVSWFGAQHVVALIDCSAAMFTPCIDWQDARISPMDAALLACERLARSRVLQVATRKTGKRDGVGVFLYGTRTHENDHDDDDDDDDEQSTEQKSSTQTLVELSPPGVQQIRTMRCCLDDRIRGRMRDIEKEFVNHCDDVYLGHKLRTGIQQANKAFLEAKFVKSPRVTSLKSPRDLKSIWIFTNVDNPHLGHDDEKRQLAQIVADVSDGGTDFVVWSLPKADGGPFDPSLLYEDLQCLVHSPPTFDMKEMLENITHQAKKPRRVLSMPMLFPDWKVHKSEPGIMVDFFKLVQEQKKPQPKWINQSTKQ
jgi:Ku70/Ku80 N-terminal alpha/beta domain